MKHICYILLTVFVLVSCKDEKIIPQEEREVEEIPNSYDLRSPRNWILSSAPLQFEESAFVNDLGYGYNRAKISWYIIDPYFFTTVTVILRFPFLMMTFLTTLSVRYSKKKFFRTRNFRTEHQ